MAAGLHDSALVDDHEPIEGGDGRQAVCHGDDGLVGHDGVQIVGDGGLDLRVQRGGSLVQQQDRRVLEHDAGQGHALALAAGEFHPALTDMGIQAAPALVVDQVTDEARMGGVDGRPQLGVRGIRPAVANIVGDGAMQQGSVLGDHADGFSQRGLGHAGDVLAVDGDLAGFQLVKTQQQREQCGLACPRTPDQADLFARGDIQREIRDHAGIVAPVVKRDALESDGAVGHG